MERIDIIAELTIQLAVKLCDGSPTDAVTKYFELLPTVRGEYDRIKAQQPVPKATTFKRSDLGL